MRLARAAWRWARCATAVGSSGSWPKGEEVMPADELAVRLFYVLGGPKLFLYFGVGAALHLLLGRRWAFRLMLMAIVLGVGLTAFVPRTMYPVWATVRALDCATGDEVGC